MLICIKSRQLFEYKCKMALKIYLLISIVALASAEYSPNPMPYTSQYVQSGPYSYSMNMAKPYSDFQMDNSNMYTTGMMYQPYMPMSGRMAYQDDYSERNKYSLGASMAPRMPEGSNIRYTSTPTALQSMQQGQMSDYQAMAPTNTYNGNGNGAQMSYNQQRMDMTGAENGYNGFTQQAGMYSYDRPMMSEYYNSGNSHNMMMGTSGGHYMQGMQPPFGAYNQAKTAYRR